MKDREFWWDAPEDRVAKAVCDRASDLGSQYAQRRAHIGRMFNLYRTGSQRARYALQRRYVRRNTSAEVVDAFSSEVAGQPPAIQITLRDVGFRAQEQARLWQWYQEAAHDIQNMPDLYDRATKDSYIAGCGFVFATDYTDGPRLERVHPEDVLIDDHGCSPQTPPHEVGRRHVIPKHVLIAECDERAENAATAEERKHAKHVATLIEQAPSTTRKKGFDLITCYEFWYKDKRRVLAAEGVPIAIDDDEWEGEAPWAYLVLQPDDRGMWGISMLDRIAPLQAGRNYASKTIQRGLRWHVPRLMASKGALDDGAITDDTKTIVDVNGDPAQVRPLEMRSASPEAYGREEYLDKTMFQAGHANEMFATGTRQPGTNSAKQLQLQRDLSTRKNLPMFRRVGAFGVQMYRELARGEVRCKENNPSHKVVVKRSGVEVDLAATVLDLDVDTLQIRAMPAGSLPMEASSRLETLNEAFDRGTIDQKTWQANSGIVEFEKAQAEDTAIVREIEAQVDSILYDDEDPVLPGFLPVPLLEMAVKKGTNAYLKARVDMRDELRKDGGDARKKKLRARLATLEKWVSIAAAKIVEKTAPPPTVAPMGPPGPGGPVDGPAVLPPMGGPPPGPAEPPPLAPGGADVIPIQ